MFNLKKDQILKKATLFDTLTEEEEQELTLPKDQGDEFGLVEHDYPRQMSKDNQKKSDWGKILGHLLFNWATKLNDQEFDEILDRNPEFIGMIKNHLGKESPQNNIEYIPLSSKYRGVLLEMFLRMDPSYFKFVSEDDPNYAEAVQVILENRINEITRIDFDKVPQLVPFAFEMIMKDYQTSHRRFKLETAMEYIFNIPKNLWTEQMFKTVFELDKNAVAGFPKKTITDEMIEQISRNPEKNSVEAFAKIPLNHENIGQYAMNVINAYPSGKDWEHFLPCKSFFQNLFSAKTNLSDQELQQLADLMIQKDIRLVQALPERYQNPNLIKQVSDDPANILFLPEKYVDYGEVHRKIKVDAENDYYNPVWKFNWAPFGDEVFNRDPKLRQKLDEYLQNGIRSSITVPNLLKENEIINILENESRDKDQGGAYKKYLFLNMSEEKRDKVCQRMFYYQNRLTPEMIDQKFPLGSKDPLQKNDAGITVYDQAQRGGIKIRGYHGTSDYFYNDIKNKNVMYSPKLLGTEDIEKRKDGLNQVYFTTDINHAKVYAIKSIIGIANNPRPIILVLDIPVTKILEFKVLSGKVQDVSELENNFKDQYQYRNMHNDKLYPQKGLMDALTKLGIIGLYELTMEASLQMDWITDILDAETRQSVNPAMKAAFFNYHLNKYGFRVHV